MAADKGYRRHEQKGFTLVEILTSLLILSVLVALVIAAAGKARHRASFASCINHLKQINVAALMYCTDYSEKTPFITTTLPGADGSGIWITYRHLLHSYLGLHHATQLSDRVFKCPADSFSVGFIGDKPTRGTSAFQLTSVPDSTSYFFNGFNAKTNAIAPGIWGLKLPNILHPEKTVFFAEAPAFVGFSWHFPQRQLLFNRSKSLVNFVDGSVRLTEIFWNGKSGPSNSSCYYDPPDGYNYCWSNQ